MNIVDKSNKIYNFQTSAHAEHNCFQGVWRLYMDSVIRLFRLLFGDAYVKRIKENRNDLGQLGMREQKKISFLSDKL